MAGRISYSGKKFSPKHTSYTALAGEIVSLLQDYEWVAKISAGIIKTNLPNLQGRYRIKIIDEGACVLLRVRGNISQQEVRVYTKDKEHLNVIMEQYCKKKSIQLIVQ